MKFINLSNQTFGRLTVTSRASNNKAGLIRWNCKCECGNITVTVGKQLRNGDTKSCGCFRVDHAKEMFATHGICNHPIYRTWKNMKNRCSNPNNPSFKNYGGRGICVCSEWDKSFPSFLSDMGERPTEKHSVDRIDNDGNYSPNNCRWATKTEQMLNTRRNHLLTHDGKTLTISQWANIIGIDQGTLEQRINRGNWSTEKALTMAVIQSKHNATP